MKVIVNCRPIELKIDYRFNGADVDSIKSAIPAVVPIRYITRIKIYHYVLKTIKSSNSKFMCNTIKSCLRKFGIYASSNILCDILPEFNKENYRNIINPIYPKDGTSWDWGCLKDNRIKFLKEIKRQCAIEYLSSRNYYIKINKTMKVNEIEFNGEIYRIVPTQDNDSCKNCALKEHCDNCTQEGDFIYNICQKHIIKTNFQKINKKNNKKDNKFYRFSSGTIFHINHIKDIIDIGYVELCAMDPTKYEFSILLTNVVAIHVRFDTKAIANRERNKFIKFIEKYENMD